MSKTKRPTAAAVRKVIQVYEREVYNPVTAWLRPLRGADGWYASDNYGFLAEELEQLHDYLRILHDDVQQGLVDWEGE